ncbi:MAG TPA: hypothetical protein VLG10_06245 [Methylomirabilota bacterium]|nr:hypothetical protein [Methylomirabilota bacterium]
MKVPALVALVLTLGPTVAFACPGCLSSAYGDRTFNWAFLGLLIMPFLVAAAIGGVLAYAYSRSRSRRRLVGRRLSSDYQPEETT